jgi:hypothetical protein
MVGELFDDAAPDTVGDLTDHLKSRGLAAMLALLAMPIALPIPMPGISALFGLPILIIATQIMVHQKRLWLPEFIRKRRIKTEKLKNGGKGIVKWLERLEAFFKPRLELLCHPVMQSLYGLICIWLAIILLLPVPFGNVLPALSIFVLAIALLERDGLAALAGLILSIATIVLTGGLVVGAFDAVWAVVHRHV